MLNENSLTALRMERLHFINKADLDSGYDELFRDLSPVPAVFWSSPGDAPTLPFHTDFNDRVYNDRRRAVREIVKGRFQKGLVGYIEAKEQELFAALYKKPINCFSMLESEILDLLQREGPMNVQYMKQMTKHLIKELSPALNKLQQAYIVFEDQVDSEWDRAWYLMESEFPDFDINRYTVVEALEIVLYRFAKRLVAFDENMAKSYYKLNAKDIKTALENLVNAGSLVQTEFGYMLPDDIKFLGENDFELPKLALVIHRNDFLARTYEYVLNKRYISKEFKTMQYILINGEFKGAVYGNFRFSPNEIEDIVLDSDIDETEKEALKERIIDGVYMANQYESPIKNYCGKPYDGGDKND